MAALRVVHVIGGGDTGGAMAHVLPMVAALRRAGCDAHLLCLGGGGLAEAAATQGLPVETVAMASPWDLRVLRPLRDRLDHFPWDVVHTHGMRANLPVRLLSPLLRRRPCLFTTVHSDLASDYASGAKLEVYRRLDRAHRRPGGPAGVRVGRSAPESRREGHGAEPSDRGAVGFGGRASARARRAGPTRCGGAIRRRRIARDWGPSPAWCR